MLILLLDILHLKLFVYFSSIYVKFRRVKYDILFCDMEYAPVSEILNTRLTDSNTFANTLSVLPLNGRTKSFQLHTQTTLS